MSFLAKLTIGSKEFTVLSSDYEVYQPVDGNNYPSASPRSNLINIVIESGDHSEVVEWMFNPHMKKSGVLSFLKSNSIGTLIKIKFTDAFCVRYREVYNSTDANPMKLYLGICPRIIELSSSKIVNKWPGYNSSDTNNSSTQETGVASTTDEFNMADHQ